MEDLLGKDIELKHKNQTADEEKQVLLRQDVENGGARSILRGRCGRASIILLMVILSVTTVFIEQTSWLLAVTVIEFIVVASLDSYLSNSRLRS